MLLLSGCETTTVGTKPDGTQEKYFEIQYIHGQGEVGVVINGMLVELSWSEHIFTDAAKNGELVHCSVIDRVTFNGLKVETRIVGALSDDRCAAFLAVPTLP
jgi:hypothetical protein